MLVSVLFYSLCVVSEEIQGYNGKKRRRGNAKNN